MTSSAEGVVLSESSSAENFFHGVEIKDGLGPMQRWERDRDDVQTPGIIVQRVADGERLKQICKSRGWPYSKVAQWVSENEEMSKAYEQALRLAADELAQETVAISDEQALAYNKQGNPFDPDVGRDTIRIKARQWVAGKLYRDRFGEQVQHNVTIDPFGEMLRRVSERKLAALKSAQADPMVPEKEINPIAAVTAPSEHDLI